MRYVIRRSIRRSYAPLAVAFLALAWSSTALAGGGDHAGKRDKLGFWDSRHAPAAQQALNDRAAELSANAPAATAALKDSLGAEGLVNLDPLTRTARFVGKTDGFLTGPSPASPADIALKYIKANAIALGLSADALAALTLRLDYVDILGTHHLSFTQVVNDVTVFGNGVKVGVTKNGQIVNVTGSPVGSFSSLSGRATPGINASQAITSARKNVELEVAPAASTASGPDLDTQFANGDSAKLVYFKTLNGLVLAWQTLVTSGDMYQSIVDASSGKVLWRQSLTHAENGKVWDNRPGAAAGGTQHDVNLAQWGQFSPTTLFSNNSLAYSDINGNNSRQASESVLPGAYLFQPFTDQTNSPCSTAYPCSWNSTFPAGAFSWQTNMKQNTVQAFYFVNTFHDHLAAAPIGFTEAAGNFQLNNTSGFGLGNDPVRTEANDGANTLCCIGGQPIGLPDPSHSDNANMSTPPDGSAPRMQMYLFNDPLTELNGFDDPFLQANGGDEAAIVYHEYTHGLSNRLVVDADGNSTLGNIQAGAMGEAWSDWYALDYLNSTGNIADVPGKADVLEGDYVSAGHDLIRTEATDCKVGTSNGDPLCDGDPSGTAGTGGYTYGDFGKIIGRPEVHADGEIWGQTLWDLRDAVGSEKSDMVVTRALELSPANPSFLDMRNAILQADLVAYNGANRDTIWKVFANRGMGYFAAAVDGDDAAPVEDFQLPPRSRKSARLALLPTHLRDG